ncbi:MAG: hypothetical protein JO139_15475 [Alphaproteobacteria bacterium]|nr:hypothetical protein [Alphaproteobacteria bacterium]MBV8336907.1 hypothetical protein [Alphaproteobacteria bacterium]
MIKLAGWFWLVLVSAAGFAMFAVKYEVQSLEEKLNRARKEIAAEQHAIRMDEVEWAYLTRPQTLEELNRRHLSLMPIATAQIRATLPDIPLRPPPPPPTELVVAGSSPQGAAESAEPVIAALPETAQEVVTSTAAPVQSGPIMATLQTGPQTSPTTAVPLTTTRTPEIAKPPIAKAVMKSAGLRRPKTLDDLIAQIVASR